MRKFRLVKNAWGYNGKVRAGGVYDETICPWWSEYLQGINVLDVAERFPEDWEEVFEDVEPTFEDRVNELEMSYVGAEHFEEVVGMLDEKIKVLEGLIKKVDVEYVRFCGDPIEYNWNIKPVVGGIYSDKELGQMAVGVKRDGVTTQDVLRDYPNEWKVVDEIAKPEQKLLPQKYQLIEVRDYDTYSWCRRLFCGFEDLRGVKVVKTLYGCDLQKFVDGRFGLNDGYSIWRQWRFIED